MREWRRFRQEVLSTVSLLRHVMHTVRNVLQPGATASHMTQLRALLDKAEQHCCDSLVMCDKHGSSGKKIISEDGVMAYLRDLRVRCHWPNCTSHAVLELFNKQNSICGCYCRVHAKMSLKALKSIEAKEKQV